MVGDLEGFVLHFFSSYCGSGYCYSILVLPPFFRISCHLIHLKYPQPAEHPNHYYRSKISKFRTRSVRLQGTWEGIQDYFLRQLQRDGKWMVIFFWPRDFTFVCPTEIKGFDEKFGEFQRRKAVLVGGSTDTAYVHLAWRNNHPDLRDLKFPMLSDQRRD